MRTTLRIDDDLLRQIKILARKEKVSFAEITNRLLRKGLVGPSAASRRKTRYQEKTFDLGASPFDLNKALSLAAAIEDEEIVRKISMRK